MPRDHQNKWRGIERRRTLARQLLALENFRTSRSTLGCHRETKARQLLTSREQMATETRAQSEIFDGMIQRGILPNEAVAFVTEEQGMNKYYMYYPCVLRNITLAWDINPFSARRTSDKRPCVVCDVSCQVVSIPCQNCHCQREDPDRDKNRRTGTRPSQTSTAVKALLTTRHARRFVRLHSLVGYLEP